MEFPNSAGLMNHLRTMVILADVYPNLAYILNLYNNLNNGCKCSHQSRITVFNHHFKALPEKLTQTEKDFLKTAFETDVITVPNIWSLQLS